MGAHTFRGVRRRGASLERFRQRGGTMAEKNGDDGREHETPSSLPYPVAGLGPGFDRSPLPMWVEEERSHCFLAVTMPPSRNTATPAGNSSPCGSAISRS